MQGATNSTPLASTTYQPLGSLSQLQRLRHTCQARSYGRCVTDDVARIEFKVNYIVSNTTAIHSIVNARCDKCDAIRFDDLPTVMPAHNPHVKHMLLSPHVRHVHTSCQSDVLSTCTTRSQNTRRKTSQRSLKVSQTRLKALQDIRAFVRTLVWTFHTNPKSL